MNNVRRGIQFRQGYTLLELMMVVTLIAVVAAIAFPSYQAYARKANAAVAEQEVMKLAEQLERHKSRNFSYRNFSPTSVTLNRGGYTLTITDDTVAGNALNSPATTGQNWVVKATTTDTKNFYFLAKSSGLRCKSKTSTKIDNICGSTVCTSCESGSDAW